MEIVLSHEKKAIIDNEDYSLIAGYKYYARNHTKDNCHAARYVHLGREEGLPQGYFIPMARDILQVYDTKVIIDHRNGNGLDNRKTNLRVATRQQNSMNRKKVSKKTSSLYKGVCRIKRVHPWRAQITYNEVSIYIGLYKTEEEAARAYDKKATELFGEFAKLNFPEGDGD